MEGEYRLTRPDLATNFSKTLIKPKNIICLFSEDQFIAFKKIINEELIKIFPLEIIDIIIEKTQYKKLIGRFGHEMITNWRKKQYNKNIINRALQYRCYIELEKDVDSGENLDNFSSDNEYENEEYKYYKEHSFYTEDNC